MASDAGNGWKDEEALNPVRGGAIVKSLRIDSEGGFQTLEVSTSCQQRANERLRENVDR